MSVELETSESRSIEEIAERLADAIKFGISNVVTIKELLLEFAEEIKREAIEP